MTKLLGTEQSDFMMRGKEARRWGRCEDGAFISLLAHTLPLVHSEMCCYEV